MQQIASIDLLAVIARPVVEALGTEIAARTRYGCIQESATAHLLSAGLQQIHNLSCGEMGMRAEKTICDIPRIREEMSATS